MQLFNHVIILVILCYGQGLWVQFCFKHDRESQNNFEATLRFPTYNNLCTISENVRPNILYVNKDFPC